MKIRLYRLNFKIHVIFITKSPRLYCLRVGFGWGRVDFILNMSMTAIGNLTEGLIVRSRVGGVIYKKIYRSTKNNHYRGNRRMVALVVNIGV